MFTFLVLKVKLCINVLNIGEMYLFIFPKMRSGEKTVYFNAFRFGLSFIVKRTQLHYLYRVCKTTRFALDITFWYLLY